MKKHHITKNLKNKRKSYYFGIIAEFIAAFFLILKGYRILKIRNKTFIGEIDIIAKKGDYLIAIEVKARKKWTPFLAEEVLSDNQKIRIRRAMDVFLSSNQKQFKEYGVRFDLIIIIPYKTPQHFIGFW